MDVITDTKTQSAQWERTSPDTLYGWWIETKRTKEENATTSCRQWTLKKQETVHLVYAGVHLKWRKMATPPLPAVNKANKTNINRQAWIDSRSSVNGAQGAHQLTTVVDGGKCVQCRLLSLAICRRTPAASVNVRQFSHNWTIINHIHGSVDNSKQWQRHKIGAKFNQFDAIYWVAVHWRWGPMVMLAVLAEQTSAQPPPPLPITLHSTFWTLAVLAP